MVPIVKLIGLAVGMTGVWQHLSQAGLLECETVLTTDVEGFALFIVTGSFLIRSFAVHLSTMSELPSLSPGLH